MTVRPQPDPAALFLLLPWVPGLLLLDPVVPPPAVDSAVAKDGKSTGISTVIGIEDILSLRSSAALRGNGSGLGTLGAGIQLLWGCVWTVAEEDEEGWADDDDDDDDDAAAASTAGSGGAGGQSAVISATASALDGCRRRTARKSDIIMRVSVGRVSEDQTISVLRRMLTSQSFLYSTLCFPCLRSSPVAFHALVLAQRKVTRLLRLDITGPTSTQDINIR